ncbi:DUF4167 domain-containing protein [Polycladidibacter hongkongensis]|uniref:DUF4167 domain-containing protein n=1 Tax=Polycladidibacter hongkongensis TaxID=1647556 RepID=UPI0009EBAD0C|nr:DUF4167 domain-containing protein [Pseudovibrio hongkongensis]
MRPGNQNNKRMRGRGGRKAPNPLTRSFESNGPDVKIRGTAMHIAEKYQQLARDAQASGDRVMGENYLQHAEHYQRIIASAQGQNSPQNSAGHSQRGQENTPQQGNGAEPAADVVEAPEAISQPKVKAEAVAEPVMGLDAPQPFIPHMPTPAEVEAASAADAAEKPADAEGSDVDDKPRRRTRGVRGRGVRRVSGAPAAALPEGDAPMGEGGEEEAAPKPKRARTPRSATGRTRRAPKKAEGEAGAPDTPVAVAPESPASEPAES